MSDVWNPPESTEAPDDFDDDLILMPVGAGVRVVARLIDVALMYAVTFGMGLALGVVFLVVDIDISRLRGLDVLTERLMAFVCLVIATTVLETVTASSPGKHVLGLHIVHDDGSPLTFGGAAGRSGFYIIDLLFCALVGILTMSNSEKGQRVGDMVGGTMVVHRNGVRNASHPGLIWGVFFAVMSISAVAQLGVLIAAG